MSGTRLTLALLALATLAACGDDTPPKPSSEGVAATNTDSEALMHWSAVAPPQFYDVPQAERGERCRLLEETCVIDDETFYLLGDVHVPVEGRENPLVLSTWVSVTKETFDEVRELWHAPELVGKKYFAWLYSGFSAFPPKTPIKANIAFTLPATRPRIVLQPNAHPLSKASHEGLSADRLDQVLNALAGDQVAARRSTGAATEESR